MTQHSLDMFALDEEVAAMDFHLAKVSNAERVFALVALAWQLRQRDYNRALRLATEALILLDQNPVSETETVRCKARIRLIRAEVNTLCAELEEGECEIQLAQAKFESIQDYIGQGDCQWLMATVWQDRGVSQQENVHLDNALQLYQAANDPLRIAATQARCTARDAFTDAPATSLKLTELFPDPVLLHDSILAWILTARATVAALTDDPGAAIKLDLQAYHASLNSGQIRHALVCAANVAEDFATLSDLDSALEWAENALSLARNTNWPYSNGFCLMQVGDVLRRLERYDEAEVFLLDAINRMQTMPSSRGHINALNHLGLLALDLGKFEQALNWFLKIEQNISAQRDRDQLIIMARGQATALLRLGRNDEAAAKAAESLELANEQGSADEQIKSLRVLAELHSGCNTNTIKHLSIPSAALHYLDQAVKIAKTVNGYKVSPDLLNQIASEHASNGDFRAAYEAGVAATEARNNSRISEAQNRAIALQVRREMDRTRADTEQHIKLAAALQNTNSTLETLGLIGRKITASLNSQEVLETLHHHADDLLDTWSFIVYLFNEDQTRLQVVYAVEKGLSRPFPYFEISIDNPSSLSARCVREKREFVINTTSDQHCHSIIPGTQKVVSMLFAPLMIGQRVLGVMSIQSPNENAYGERERSIFHTLCAYGAIALDNAAAYSAVEKARERSLIHEQELHIAAIAFESQEGMFITDAKQTILKINSAFTKISGFSAEDVVGQNPRMFKSVKHDKNFYRMVLQSVAATESWQGEVWTKRKNGEEFPLWLTVTAVRSTGKIITNYIYSLVDITDRKVAEDEIRNLAFYDPLTKLPNRRLLTERLQHALATSARTYCHGALLFIDLDNFKKLNDTRGHDVGDLLLEMVGQRLSMCLRQGDTAARLGGDEFVVLLEDLNEEITHAADLSELVAQKIQCELNLPYMLKGKTHHISPSIGVTLFKSNNVTVDDLLKHADLAMYQAKDAGRNTIRFFDPEMQKAVDDHAALESDLRQAIAGQQFVLHYQVQTNSNDQIVGAEALIRWNHPERGMVSPAEFIPVAEENGLILQIGEWILDSAAKQLHQWSLQPETADWSLAINISARQFHDAHFVDNVLTSLKRNSASPNKLKIELTESLLLKDIDGVITKMRALMLNGVRFSLDDFGTGYSSLAYLKRLPLEQLKIDQSFIRDIFIDSNDMAIVRAIVTLGLSMGLGIIAEGVETAEQKEFLRSCGCRMFQGYLFGRPIPAELLTFHNKDEVST